jgi:hypothetical protein
MTGKRVLYQCRATLRPKLSHPYATHAAAKRLAPTGAYKSYWTKPLPRQWLPYPFHPLTASPFFHALFGA